MTFADGEVHTFQINLAQQSGWTGTIAQIRIDPTTGGNGNFGIDSLRFTTAAKPEGRLSQEWQWTTENDTLGWTIVRTWKTVDMSCTWKIKTIRIC